MSGLIKAYEEGGMKGALDYFTESYEYKLKDAKETILRKVSPDTKSDPEIIDSPATNTDEDNYILDWGNQDPDVSTDVYDVESPASAETEVEVNNTGNESKNRTILTSDTAYSIGGEYYEGKGVVFGFNRRINFHMSDGTDSSTTEFIPKRQK